MISQNIHNFLKTLGQNNNREWFHENKRWYQEVKEEFNFFVNILIHELGTIDPEIRSLEAKDCTFRIYRDIRFSKNKEPYKTNMGAFIVKGGKKSGNAGYYVHVEPGNCFFAGGMHNPDSSILKVIRQGIYDNIEEFKEIINNPSFKKIFPEIYGDKLKRAPKDFPADFQDIDLLKHKSYTVFHSFPDEKTLGENFMEFLKSGFLIMRPFNYFLNSLERSD